MPELVMEAGKWLQLSADLLTTVLGLYAAYGLIFKRKELSQLVRVLSNNHLNESLRRLRETLSQLQRVPMDDASRQGEGKSLLGQLSGQLRGLADRNADISRLRSEVQLMLEGKRKVQDYKKNAVIHEIEAVLEQLSLEAYVDLTAKDQG